MELTQLLHAFFTDKMPSALQLTEILNAVCVGNDKLCYPGEQIGMPKDLLLALLAYLNQNLGLYGFI